MNRRLIFLFSVVCVFAVGVIYWYFFMQTPKSAPSLSTTNDLSIKKEVSPRLEFVTKYFSGESFAGEKEGEASNKEVFKKIWANPVTGETFVSYPIIREVVSTSTASSSVLIKKSVRTTTTVLLFVDRITGYIYSYQPETDKIYQLTNTTLPGVYDAYIFDSGKRVLIRYLSEDKKDIISIVGNIPSFIENPEPKSIGNFSFLPKNISSVCVSPSSLKLNYFISNSTGGSIYEMNSKGEKFITTSPLSEITLLCGGGQLYAMTKPSAFVEGFVFSIPSWNRVLGNKTGLLVNPSPKEGFIGSMWSKNGLLTFLFSNGGESTVLSFKTLASKCSWSDDYSMICAQSAEQPRTKEGLPDDWYMGSLSFNDSLIFVDGKTGEFFPLYYFDSAFDVENIESFYSKGLISLRKKEDGSLWLINFSNRSSE